MKNFSTFKVLVMTIGLFSGLFSAQNITGKSATVSVSGTSPMHDWTMTSNTANFSGTVSGNSITNVKFAMAAKNLKSTKGKIMDNKAYNALKADKNPNISFTAATLNVGKSTLSGKLSIAGVTKTVSLPVSVIRNGKSYHISATEDMKMSDFGIETPGFLGVHTGDAITVHVTITAN
ncbi:YceI family protein [Chryseobacterium sp.]|uniref:YceI family protein n=1 Tax=Chryseobacterium sp. TaxID=1871047 RepID=UPI0011C7ABBA|nr:YceI family protein [Chryseobacterium sp.]TXF77653.1 YceI family protein [Chryseobacterium sp.]